MIILNETQIAVRQPRSIVPLLQQWFSTHTAIEQQQEHFFTVLLDARQKVKLIDVTFVGTLNTSLVHPREVFVRAIVHSAAFLIIAHNHPSEVCEPSDADDTITAKLVQAGDVLSIPLIDHIIFSSKGFYSFQAHGRIATSSPTVLGIQETCFYGNEPAVKDCCRCTIPLCSFCGYRDDAGRVYCNRCWRLVGEI